MGMVFIETNP